MLTSAQIVTLACQEAKTPGMLVSAGQKLNQILGDLCQDYDLDVAKGVFTFNFNPGITGGLYANIITPGTGPYPLPADFLRVVPEEVTWYLLGVPYPMVNISLQEFLALVQQPGLQSYPARYATDMRTSPPTMYVYDPPSGAYPVVVGYRRQMPDIVTPETSAAVPWFPNQRYLNQALAGEMMKTANDDRWQEFLGDEPQYPNGAQAVLKRYLQLKDDKSARAQTVKLDRRRFGAQFQTLPNTKQVGW